MNDRIDVHFSTGDDSIRVGSMLDVGDGPWFEYAPEFIETGIELSPIKLPLRAAAFEPGPHALGRLRGLFADTVPTGWGRRLLDQALRDAGHDPRRVSPLMRLRAVGARGMGALTYRPAMPDPPLGPADHDARDLQTLAAQAFRVDANELEQIPPALARAGSVSGGVRPKLVLAWRDDGAVADAFGVLPPGHRHVLVKFRASTDWVDLPAIECAYLDMAHDAGLAVPPHRLVKLGRGKRSELALVIDRFDREGEERRHVHTLAGALEIDHQRDLVDYRALMDVAMRLTHDVREIQAAWLRAVFNVAVSNRDDHAQNIAFLMRADGRWSLAPAYDLTFSKGAGGYHTMSVDGESRAPTRAHLLRLAVAGQLDRATAVASLDRVREVVSRWERYADAAQVSRAHRNEIATALATQDADLAAGRTSAPIVA